MAAYEGAPEDYQEPDMYGSFECPICGEGFMHGRDYHHMLAVQWIEHQLRLRRKLDRGELPLSLRGELVPEGPC